MRLLAGIIIVAVTLVSPVKAEDTNLVAAIVEKMKEVYEPSRPSTRKVVFTQHAEGETIAWTARQARKQFPDGKRMLMVMTAPDDVKGTATLVWEPKDKPTVMWTYSPLIRRVRQLATVDAYEHFLGTDFTYADLGFVALHQQYKLLGEESVGNVNAYKVEETVPQERFYYSRVVTWVAKDSLLPVKREYYDPAGKVWKTETFENIATIDGVPTPLRVRMKDEKSGWSTEMAISEVAYDVEIPDIVFDPQSLPQILTQPLWQTATSHPTNNP